MAQTRTTHTVGRHFNWQLNPHHVARKDAMQIWEQVLRPDAALLRRMVIDPYSDRRAVVASLVQRAGRGARQSRRLTNALHSAQPRRLPNLSGWEIAGRYMPAEEVGGDFYDLVPLADGRVGVLMGDVSGKGRAAAVLMAMARSILRAEAVTGDTPAQVLRRANDAIVEVMPQGYFLTCLYVLLDPATGALQMANAGHNLPWVWSESDVVKVDATGLPLGLFADVQYDEVEGCLPAGASMIFYSDGIPEARNQQGEFFGLGGMCRAIGGMSASADPASLADAILASACAHAGCPKQEDDIALLVLKRHLPVLSQIFMP